MNHRLLVVLSLAASSSIACLVAACGGGNNNPDGGSDATTSDVSSADVADTGSSDTGNDTGGNDASGGDGSCSPGAGCRACCTGLYPDAAATVLADETTCACTTPGDCEAGAACGNSLCMNKNASQACNQCLRNPDAGDCQNAALTACKASSACAPLATCLSQCVLPPKDAGGGG